MKLNAILFATAVAGAAVSNEKLPLTTKETPEPTELSKFPLLVNVHEHEDCTGEKRPKYLANDAASGGHINGEPGFSSISINEIPDTDDRWTITVIEHRDGSGRRKEYHDSKLMIHST